MTRRGRLTSRWRSDTRNTSKLGRYMSDGWLRRGLVLVKWGRLKEDEANLTKCEFQTTASRFFADEEKQVELFQAVSDALAEMET